MRKTILAALCALPLSANADGYLAPFLSTQNDSCDVGCGLSYDVDRPDAGVLLGIQGGRAFVYGGELQVSNADIGANAYAGVGAGRFQALVGGGVTVLDASADLGPSYTTGKDSESVFMPFVDLSYAGFFMRAARYDADFTLKSNAITGYDADGNAILGADREDRLETTVTRYSAGYRITF